MGTSYVPGTVLGAENTIMNKAVNAPTFMEINSVEGDKVREGWRRAQLIRDPMDMRNQTMGTSGERAFQAEEQANAKILKCLYVQGRRPVSEEKRGREGNQRGSRDLDPRRTSR